MTSFPEDSVLLARGKYSTLGRERHKQLQRVQSICRTINASVLSVLRECELIKDAEPVGYLEGCLVSLEGCIGNLKDAKERLVEIGTQMVELKPQAWGEVKEE